MKLNRLHLSFLLLMPLFFIIMNGSKTLDIETRYAVMVVALIGTALWIWFIIRDVKDESVPEETERY